MRALFLSAIVLPCLFIATFSLASPQGEAQKQLEAAITSLVEHVKNPAYANPALRKALQEEIKKEVYAIFDFEAFSMRTVGPHWKNFNATQKKAFSDAFAELLFATYLDSIDSYNGETITYTGQRANRDGTRVEITSIVTLDKNRKVPMAYRMLPKNGKWYIYDVLIENMSLVKNFRSQFNDILMNGSPEALIARVKERAAIVREKTYEKK